MSEGEFRKRFTRRRALRSALALAALVIPAAAAARKERRADDGSRERRERRTHDADAAAAAVRAQCRCRVLGVAADPGGAPIWLVKVLLAGGRVRLVRVDARSGRILD